MSTMRSFAVRATPTNRQALIFIHGFSGDAYLTFGMLPAFLAGDPALASWDIHCVGYPSGLAPDIAGLWTADPDLTALAGYLTTLLKDGKYRHYDSLAFVAHSMGGLIVQRALLDGDFLSRVRHVALFGTPSGGLHKAGLGALFKRQARDMKRGGDFITRLRSDWQTRFGAGTGFQLRVTAGLRDEFVPHESSVTPFPESCQWFVDGDHLQMVKPQNADDGASSLLRHLLAASGAPGAGVSPKEHWAGEVAKYQGREGQLGTAELVQYVLALEMTGQQERAIQLLEARHAGDPELTGVLAGRYKRRWLADPEAQAAAGQRAYALYREGFEAARKKNDDAGACYTGINVAFLELALKDSRYDARVAAEQTLQHARRAPRDKWRLATEGEAQLYLGDSRHAIDCYLAALRESPTERERDSMLRQGLWACQLLELPEVEARLRAAFGVHAAE